MFMLATWTADGVQTMGLRFTDYRQAVLAGLQCVRYGCVAYRVRPV